MTNRSVLLLIFGSLLSIACSASPDPQVEGGGPAEENPTTNPTPAALCGMSAPGDATWAPTPGPEGSRIAALAANESVVLVVRDHALYRSTDRGVTWTHITTHEGPLAGVLVQDNIVLGAHEGEFFLGAYDGIYRSTDGGLTWAAANAGLLPGVDPTVHGFSGRSPFIASVSGIPHRWDASKLHWVPLAETPDDLFGAIDADSGTMLATSPCRAGVFRRSGDNAWTQIEELPAWGYRAVAIRGELAFAASAVAFVRSRDKGESWTNLDTWSAIGRIEHLALVDRTLFAHTETGLFRSDDEGETWTSIHAAEPMRSSIVRSGDSLFLGADRLYRSSGGAFEPITTLRSATPSLLANVAGSLFAVVDEATHVSRDGGKSWTKISGAFAPSQRFTGFAARGSYIYATTTEFSGWPTVYRSVDGGRTFKTALPLPIHYSESVSATGIEAIDGVLYVATASRYVDRPGLPSSVSTAGAGVWRSDNGGREWTQISEGMPFEGEGRYGTGRYPSIRSLRSTDGTLWASTYDGNVYSSKDAGVSWKLVSMPAPVKTIATFAGGPIAFAEKSLFVARAGGWSKLTDGLPAGGEIVSFASDGPRAFAVVAEGDLRSLYWMTADTGRWSDARASLPGDVRSLSLIGNTLYGGVAGTGVWTRTVPICSL